MNQVFQDRQVKGVSEATEVMLVIEDYGERRVTEDRQVCLEMMEPEVKQDPSDPLDNPVKREMLVNQEYQDYKDPLDLPGLP